jgi:hypothetical protein
VLRKAWRDAQKTDAVSVPLSAFLSAVRRRAATDPTMQKALDAKGASEVITSSRQGVVLTTAGRVCLRSNATAKNARSFLAAVSSLPQEGVAFDAFREKLSRLNDDEVADGLTTFDSFLSVKTTTTSESSMGHRTVAPRFSAHSAGVTALVAQLLALQNSDSGLLHTELRAAVASAISMDETSVDIDSLLAATQDMHFEVRGKIRFLDWRELLLRVQARLPQEGVLEHTFMMHINTAAPADFALQNLNGISLSELVASRFSDLINVRVAADGTTVIFSPQTTGGGATLDAQLHRCLGDAIAWTDVQPLLPQVHGSAKDHGGQDWLQALVHGAPRHEVEVRLVAQERTDVERVALFVDGSSLTSDEVDAVLTDVARLRWAGVVQHTVVRKKTDRQHTAADVVAAAWMDNDVVIAAHLSKLRAANASATDSVLLICSDAAASTYAAALADVTHMKAVLATPSGVHETAVLTVKATKRKPSKASKEKSARKTKAPKEKLLKK